jgi:hypothetical protein
LEDLEAGARLTSLSQAERILAPASTSVTSPSRGAKNTYSNSSAATNMDRMTCTKYMSSKDAGETQDQLDYRLLFERERQEKEVGKYFTVFPAPKTTTF